MTTSVPAAPGIGHNSVQVPHNGVQRDRPVSTLAGARFRAKSLFRPTAMSVAMADAGIIPAGHLIADRAMSGLLRHRRDAENTGRSIRVSF